MLATNSFELVERCYGQICDLMEMEEMKLKFIDYVFSDYQDEVLKKYDVDFFFEHLNRLQLIQCRKDFDLAVEAWYEKKSIKPTKNNGFHSKLFALVKRTIGMYQAKDKHELVKYVTQVLTSNEFMAKWQENGQKSKAMYFQYLDRLGVRSYQDIESLVEVWLIENPQAFDEYRQQYYKNPARRGRPNNVELSRLLDQILQVKPDLSHKEKERLRKIYYYHRHQMGIEEMVGKFLKYLEARDKESRQVDGEKIKMEDFFPLNKHES
ncbi:hypothetical protein [Brevibacillus daliensis]|uniref:hypothetical protein n=1 Tax=Brevibacillus daliensis TaxID=2892995 RepID=UPI001E50CCC1|nr:hypothetical protein [Brevibacillus daliensis]